MAPTAQPPQRTFLSRLAGAAGILSLLLVVTGIALSRSIGLCDASIPLLLGTVLFAVLTVILGLVARARFAWGAGAVAAVAALLMLAYGYQPFHPCGGRIATNDGSAMSSLRAVATATLQYHANEMSFPHTLQELGEADLIDPILASGEKAGFRFEYRPGPPDAEGRIQSYTIQACPLELGRTGSRNYFMDQSGVIRSTREDRPATRNDTPIS